MSLDLVVLGPDDRPERTVSIGVEQHARLMRYAVNMDLRVIQFLEDYYDDVLFSGDELARLAEECATVASAAGNDSDIVRLMGEVIDLVSFARDEMKEIEALAD